MSEDINPNGANKELYGVRQKLKSSSGIADADIELARKVLDDIENTPHFLCDTCDEKFTWDVAKNYLLPRGFRYRISKRLIVDGIFYCRKCGEKAKRNRKALSQSRMQYLADSFKMEVKNCKVAGTCEIFKAHHKLLQNDPERLKTEFLIGIVCGEDGVNKYKAKKDRQNTNIVENTPKNTRIPLAPAAV